MTPHLSSQMKRRLSNTAHCLLFTGNFIRSKAVMPDLVTFNFKGLLILKDYKGTDL